MKLKLLLILTALGLILAVANSTWAGSFSPTGYGLTPIRYHLTNYDMGTVWYANAGHTVLPVAGLYGDPRVAGDGFINAPGDDPVLFADQAKGAIGMEDTWGIIRLDQVLPAYVDELHRNLEPTGDPALYNLGDSGIEVYGIFYGHQDTFIEVTADGGQNAMGPGMNFEIWAQPLGTFASINGPIANKNYGSAQRLGTNMYAGIGYDAAGDPILGASRWLTGESTPGFLFDSFNMTVDNYTFASQFWPAGNLDGEAQMWAELWDDINNPGKPVGTANATYDSDPIGWYWDEIPDGILYTADMRLQLDTKFVTPNASFPNFDWRVTSSDPGQLYPIPEPVTMLGVFLGLGSLVGYVRKVR